MEDFFCTYYEALLRFEHRTVKCRDISLGPSAFDEEGGALDEFVPPAIVGIHGELWDKWSESRIEQGVWMKVMGPSTRLNNILPHKIVKESTHRASQPQAEFHGCQRRFAGCISSSNIDEARYLTWCDRPPKYQSRSHIRMQWHSREPCSHQAWQAQIGKSSPESSVVVDFDFCGPSNGTRT